MKYLAVFLLIGCLASPAWSTERDVALEEFVQKLEKAKPWTREKIETLLESRFTKISSTGVVISHDMSGSFVRGKGLIFNEISFSVLTTTGEALYVEATLDDKSSCFTWEQIKNSYPGGSVDFMDVASGGEVYYAKKLSGGDILFGFDGRKDGNCLTSITVRTNLFLKVEK
ncbi:MAG: hypothetical protein FWD67_08830 [Betaproteobacteria bacterium]|nr:hypothetical protein [Betaproteobacteria bacterium]